MVSSSNKKRVGLAPSDFVSGPQPLDLFDAPLVGSIHGMTFEEFRRSYSYPPKEPDGYLDMRGVPPAWSLLVDGHSDNHLFLYALCLAEADENLKELLKVRDMAKDQCRKSGDEGSILWLASRPSLSMKMIVTVGSKGSRRKFPAWSPYVKDRMVSFANSIGTSARVLLVAFSCKALLAGEGDLGGLIGVAKKESENFDFYARNEVKEITSYFGLKKAT